MGGGDDAVVEAGGEEVDGGVDDAEEEEGDGGGEDLQGLVGEAEEEKHFGDHGEGEDRVEPGPQKGQEEDGEDLGVDGPADLRLGHAHLLQRAEPGLVLVALGDLLVVDDEDRGQEEQKAQENAQEEETAKEGEETPLLIGPGLQGHVLLAPGTD